MEGLGAASGVIAVAQVTIQLGQTVQTLVGFWKAVRDAPEDVEMLFEEFSMLSSLIAQTREKGPYEESDPIIDTASCRCNALLSKLKAKLPPSTSDFKTASSRVRTWKRLKHALKKNEIKELMGSIERIKTTLTFAHIRNIGQTQRLLENFARTQQMPRLNASDDAHDHSSLPVRVDFRLAASAQDTATSSRVDALTRETILRNKSQHQSFLEHNDRSDDSISLTEYAATKTYSSLWGRAILIRTPLYSISYHTRTHKVTTTTSAGNQVTVVKSYYCTVYPSRLVAIFGFSCGLWAASSCSAPGRWSLSPFNAVPSHSLIFDFCRNGYLPGIRTLLQRGDASVRDMDPTGRTPFNVATEFFQVEAAKLLMQEGADPYLGNSTVPFLALESLAPTASQAGFERRLSTISLLQNLCRDRFDEEGVYHMLGRLLLFCRPQKHIAINQASRRDNALKAVVQLSQELSPCDRHYRPPLVNFMIQFHYTHAPLRWMLRSIKGQFEWGDCDSDCTCSGCGAPILLEALKRKLPYRDPESTRLIMEKTKDIHRTLDSSFVSLGPNVSLITATSLAMRQPSMFFPFRDCLLELGHEMDDFVEKELGVEGSPLATEGWDKETLSILFKSNVFPNTHNGILLSGFLSCQRCSTKEPGPIMVDLPWRRHLRNIRTRKNHDSCCGEHASVGLQWPSDEVMTANLLQSDDFGVEDPKLLAIGDALEKNSRAVTKVPGRLNFSGVLETWPYHFVCPKSCADGVCVSGAYENDFTDEPDLPPYHETDTEHHSGTAAGDNSINNVDGDEIAEDESYPTTMMPGAYIE